MIYTLTANPAIDYNIACDGLAANTVTRTRNAVYTPTARVSTSRSPSITTVSTPRSWLFRRLLGRVYR